MFGHLSTLQELSGENGTKKCYDPVVRQALSPPELLVLAVCKVPQSDNEVKLCIGY